MGWRVPLQWPTSYGTTTPSREVRPRQGPLPESTLSKTPVVGYVYLLPEEPGLPLDSSRRVVVDVCSRPGVKGPRFICPLGVETPSTSRLPVLLQRLPTTCTFGRPSIHWSLLRRTLTHLWHFPTWRHRPDSGRPDSLNRSSVSLRPLFFHPLTSFRHLNSQTRFNWIW